MWESCGLHTGKLEFQGDKKGGFCGTKVKAEKVLVFPSGCVHAAAMPGNLHVYSPLGLGNPSKPLLVAGPSSTGSSDSDGGLFAVPTTLPPNSRLGKLFSPSKDTELTFRQHLNSISVSAGSAAPHPGPHVRGEGREGLPWLRASLFLPDAVGLLPAKAPEVAEPAPAEAAGGPGQELPASAVQPLWLGCLGPTGLLLCLRFS